MKNLNSFKGWDAVFAIPADMEILHGGNSRGFENGKNKHTFFLQYLALLRGQ